MLAKYPIIFYKTIVHLIISFDSPLEDAKIAMRVLMINRATHYSTPGGDTVQVECTAEFLRKLGVEVDIAIGTKRIDYSKYDLLHFFNIIRPAIILAHIKQSKKPYVVSTIFVDYDEYERFGQKGLRKIIWSMFPSDVFNYFKVIARKIRNGEPIGSLKYLLIGHRASIRYIAKKAAMLLPNSSSEYSRLSTKYMINVPFTVVPNAIHSSIFVNAENKNLKFQDAVICVARIEGLKNQLNLIKAMEGLDIPLFIIGKPSPNHIRYYEECRRIARKNVKFVNHLSQQELSGIYSVAKVHAMPSWFETTGLSSLEAAAMGCNIVITSKGDQKEYFRDFAYYCEPDNIDSIRNAILKALAAPRNSLFQEYIINSFTWEKTAEKTVEAYISVLGKTKESTIPVTKVLH